MKIAFWKGVSKCYAHARKEIQRRARESVRRINFVLPFCHALLAAARVHVRVRISVRMCLCTGRSHRGGIAEAVSGRPRRGRGEASQPAGSLSLSLSSPPPLPPSALSVSLSGVSGSVYRSYRAEASNDVDGHHAEYIFAPGVIEARSARVGGTIHTGI